MTNASTVTSKLLSVSSLVPAVSNKRNLIVKLTCQHCIFDRFQNRRPSCLPFPKHWLAYLALKIIVLALAIYLGAPSQ